MPSAEGLLESSQLINPVLATFIILLLLVPVLLSRLYVAAPPTPPPAAVVTISANSNSSATSSTAFPIPFASALEASPRSTPTAFPTPFASALASPSLGTHRNSTTSNSSSTAFPRLPTGKLQTIVQAHGPGQYLLTVHLGADEPHASHGRLCIVVESPILDPWLKVSKCLPPDVSTALAATGAPPTFVLHEPSPGSTVHTSLLVKGGERRVHVARLPEEPLRIAMGGSEDLGVLPAPPRLTLLSTSTH